MVTVSGTRIETYFESEGDVGARLAALIEEAHSVRFMAFSFTDSLEWTEGSTQRSVMLLLRDRALAGALDVRGIVEASSRSQIKPLLCAGLDVRQDGNPYVMHHKVFIFDEATVAMGSFNFRAGRPTTMTEYAHHPQPGYCAPILRNSAGCGPAQVIPDRRSNADEKWLVIMTEAGSSPPKKCCAACGSCAALIRKTASVRSASWHHAQRSARAAGVRAHVQERPRPSVRQLAWRAI